MDKAFYTILAVINPHRAPWLIEASPPVDRHTVGLTDAGDWSRMNEEGWADV